MLKKILLVLLLLPVLLQAQEVSQELTEEQKKQEEKIFNQKSQVPLFLLGSYQFNMIDNKGLIFDSSFTLNIELHYNASFNINKYSAFIYIKVGGLFSLVITPKLQVGAGISGYVYNNRNKQTKLGWSVMLGSGLLINTDVVDSYIDIGYELFLRGQYNFHKYVGLVLGLSFEYFHSIRNLWDRDFTYLDDDINLFNIGMTVGLAF